MLYKKWRTSHPLPLFSGIVLLGGLYAVAEFIRWLNKKTISFEMRFHANRMITCKEVTAQIRKHPRFSINGKNPRRTVRIIWQDIELYATAYRRIMKNGEFSIVYQIANYKASAFQHIRAYSYRWNIEKFFRTAKQKLGLNDCMARKRTSQENHIMAVFLAYAFAQKERLRLKLKNVESAIKSIKQSDSQDLKQRFNRSAENFAHA
jgi:hypothetical protein